MGHAAVRSEASTPGVAAGVSSVELEACNAWRSTSTNLQSALSARDMPCIELHAGELQKALSLAVERFMQAARRGGPPLPLRRRLGLASAQVAAQRDALARATAALDRAIDVLMPGHGSALYSPSGAQHPRRSRASIEA